MGVKLMYGQQMMGIKRCIERLKGFAEQSCRVWNLIAWWESLIGEDFMLSWVNLSSSKSWFCERYENVFKSLETSSRWMHRKLNSLSLWQKRSLNIPLKPINKRNYLSTRLLGRPIPWNLKFSSWLWDLVKHALKGKLFTHSLIHSFVHSLILMQHLSDSTKRLLFIRQTSKLSRNVMQNVWANRKGERINDLDHLKFEFQSVNQVHE